MNSEDIDMTPKIEDDTILIPVSFENRNTIKEKKSQKVLLGIAIWLVFIILSFINFMKDAKILNILIYEIIILIIGVLLFEKFVIKKKYYIEVTEDLEKNNYNLNTEKYWGIYNTDSEYPYYKYFKNGDIGLLVRLEKGVPVGDITKEEFKHFNAISDALNLLGNTKIKATHIDLMDSVGKDDRLQELNDSLRNYKSQSLKKLYTSIYENLRKEMEREYASYDYYMFRLNGTEEELIYLVNELLRELLRGNYSSYTITDDIETRAAVESTFSLEGFSILEANKNTRNTELARDITSIYSLTYEGEKTVFNKTEKERKDEIRIAQNEEIARDRVKKELKKKKIKDEEIDLDEN